MNHRDVTYARHASYITFYESIKDCGRADDVRPLSDSRDALGENEQRVVAGNMASYAVFYSIAEQPLGRSCEPWMKKTKFGKALVFPACQLSFHFFNVSQTCRHPQPTMASPPSFA